MTYVVVYATNAEKLQTELTALGAITIIQVLPVRAGEYLVIHT